MLVQKISIGVAVVIRERRMLGVLMSWVGSRGVGEAGFRLGVLNGDCHDHQRFSRIGRPPSLDPVELVRGS